MDADYADDITLLANRAALAEFLLNSLERAAGGIGLHVTQTKQRSSALIKEVTS